MTCPLGLTPCRREHRIHRLFPESRHLVSPVLRESLAADAGVAAATATSSRASTSSRVRTLWARVTLEKPLPSVAPVPIKSTERARSVTPRVIMLMRGSTANPFSLSTLDTREALPGGGIHND